MTSQSNQKVQLLVKHFITRNDDIFLDNDPNIKIAELFVKMTIKEGLFDERHVFSRENVDNHQLELEECLKRIKSGEDGAALSLIEAIANHESYKYRLEIPYEDITELIYDTEDNINSLGLEQKFQGFEFALKDAAKNCELVELRKIEKTYKKFKRHLKLAVAQKEYFQLITKKAEESAISADEQSTKAKETAEKAENEALIAQELSKKAKDMSDGMVTNFVTILGVFATIIITVFGGINIVGATVKLLEGNNKLVYLVFVVSFLMVCLLTLIRLLISWIASIRGIIEVSSNNAMPSDGWCKRIYKSIANSNFYTRSILCFLVIIAVSGFCIMLTHKNQNIKPKLDDSKPSNQNSVFFINTEKPETQETKEPQKNIAPIKP